MNQNQQMAGLPPSMNMAGFPRPEESRRTFNWKIKMLTTSCLYNTEFVEGLGQFASYHFCWRTLLNSQEKREEVKQSFGNWKKCLGLILTLERRKRSGQFELSPIPVLQHSITLSLLEIQNSTQSNLLPNHTQSLQLA